MLDELNTPYDSVYHAILDRLPVSIWVEDWSPVKVMIDEIASDGMEDWRCFFEHRPEMTIEAANTIEVIDVNQATLALYRAKSKEEVIDATLGEQMSRGELKAFREQLIAFAEGETQFTIDAEELTMDGLEIQTRIFAGIVPTYCDDWSMVYSIIEEKAERLPAEQAFIAAPGVAMTDCESANVMERVHKDDFTFWGTIKDSPNADDYEAYLETFPEGIFAPLARRRIMLMGAKLETFELSPSVIIPPIGMDFDQLNEKAKRNTERAMSKAAKFPA